jgi:PST family polysaccharide transporter
MTIARNPAMSASGNARWIGLIQLSRIGAQLVSLVFLSRLLSPQEFGLVAMAVAVTNFAQLLRDLGTAAAIIQKPQLDERTITTAFWMNCAFGTLLGLTIALSAPWVAALFKAPQVKGLLLLLAVAFPIGGVTIVHQALLERAGRFALVARVEITSAFAGLCVALIAANAHGGAYSLVLQSLTIACASTLQLLVQSEWKPRWVWGKREFLELWRFGGPVSGSNFINYFARNVDSVVIGRVLGAVSLGPYSLANRIMLFPLYNLTFVATRALFPVMSQVMSCGPQRRNDLAGLYLRALATIAFFTAPLMAGLFVLREPFVNVFLGARWSPVIELIAWLAPVGFVQSLLSPSGSVFMALGRPDLLPKVGGISMLLQVLSFVIGVRWGVVGVAQCYLLATVLSAVLCSSVTLLVLGSRPRQLFAALYRPVAIALVMACCVHLWHANLHASLREGVQLALFAGGGALLYFGLMQMAAPALAHDVLKVLANRREQRMDLPEVVAQREGAL